jgi:hypothetical protein
VAQFPLQGMYFESLSGIVSALRAIAGDPDVRLARIVNRLDPSYDASATAGYRDVLVNLVSGCGSGESAAVHVFPFWSRFYAQFNARGANSRYILPLYTIHPT